MKKLHGRRDGSQMSAEGHSIQACCQKKRKKLSITKTFPVSSVPNDFRLLEEFRAKQQSLSKAINWKKRILSAEIDCAYAAVATR